MLFRPVPRLTAVHGMDRTANPLVDDELYVNDATLEALRNAIESEVRGSLRRTVLWPLLLAGIALLIVAAFWLIPREVENLVREDPIVKQRFLSATTDYIADPEGGQKAIQEQVVAAVRADQDLQNTVNVAVSSVVDGLNVNAVVEEQVAQGLEARLNKEVTRFLNSEKGQGLINDAVRDYFESETGRVKLDTVTAQAIRSADFKNALIDDLDHILSR